MTRKRTQVFASFSTAFDGWHIINQQLPNPDPILRRTGSGITVYNDLLADSQVAACLRSRKTPVLAKEWTLEQGGCPTKIFRVLDKWFEEFDIQTFLEDFLDIIFWGYYPVETMWDYRGKYFLPVSLTPKPPEWFSYIINEAGMPELRFMSQRNPVDGELPPDDFTIFCPRIAPSFKNPYGRGVASLCFWPVAFKKGGMEFWLNFLERFGIPWVKGKTSGDLDDFRNKLVDLVQDAIIALNNDGNNGDDVELLVESGRSGSGDLFERLCVFMDNQISKAILSQTLTTEIGDKGALAAAKVHSDVRSDITDADLKVIQRALQLVFGLIMRRNGFLSELAPKVTAHEEVNIKSDLAERDAKLVPALKASGLVLSRDYWIRQYDFEESDLTDSVSDDMPEESEKEQEEIPEEQEEIPEEFAGQTDPVAALEKNQEILDGITEQGTETTDPLFRDMMEQALEILGGCSSYEEAVGKMKTVFPKIPVQGITEIMSKAFFAGSIWGRVSE
ncbi:MAG: DUF935 family protein [Desulfobacteraceae bacterium]|nr:DUF935 family protein [Desulfobacteraceae bacterium]